MELREKQTAELRDHAGCSNDLCLGIVPGGVVVMCGQHPADPPANGSCPRRTPWPAVGTSALLL